MCSLVDLGFFWWECIPRSGVIGHMEILFFVLFRFVSCETPIVGGLIYSLRAVCKGSLSFIFYHHRLLFVLSVY